MSIQCTVAAWNTPCFQGTVLSPLQRKWLYILFLCDAVHGVLTSPDYIGHGLEKTDSGSLVGDATQNLQQVNEDKIGKYTIGLYELSIMLEVSSAEKGTFTGKTVIQMLGYASCLENFDENTLDKCIVYLWCLFGSYISPDTCNVANLNIPNLTAFNLLERKAALVYFLAKILENIVGHDYINQIGGLNNSTTAGGLIYDVTQNMQQTDKDKIGESMVGLYALAVALKTSAISPSTDQNTLKSYFNCVLEQDEDMLDKCIVWLKCQIGQIAT